MTGGPTDPDKLSEAQSTKFVRVIDAETGNVVQIELIDTGRTTVDNIPIYTLGVGASGGGLNVVIVSKTIGEATFTGSGLDDMTNGGEFTGNSDIVYKVEIDGTGAPDTFKWYKNGVPQTPATINIDGTNQALDNGITIKFAATTGHTLADFWTFTARAADPAAIRKPVTTLLAISPGPGSSGNSAIMDMRRIESAVIEIRCTFNIAATLGLTVNLYASMDGITFDEEPWVQNLEPTFVAGVTTLAGITHNLDALPPYMRAGWVNLDGVQGIGGLSIKIAEIEKS